MEMLWDKFPDGVDIAQARFTFVCEISSGGLTNPSTMDKMAPLSECPIEMVDLILTEVELETGIYAAMSPITHTVYVFIDWSQCG